MVHQITCRDVNIEELVDIMLLKRILDGISVATGVPIKIFENNNFLICESSRRNDNQFYDERTLQTSLPSNHSCSAKRLLKTKKTIFYNENKKINYYNCSCGFNYLIEPLELNGTIFGFLQSNRFKLREFYRGELERISKNLGLSHPGADDFTVESMKVPISDFNNIHIAQTLISVAKDTVEKLIKQEWERIQQANIRQRLHQAENISKVVEIIVNIAKEYTGGDKVSLLMLQQKDGALHSVLQRGIGYHEIPRGRGVAQKTIREKSVQRIGDVREYKNYFRTNPKTRSHLAIPLEYKESVIGVLDIQSEKQDNFTIDHENYLKSLAYSFGHAYERTRRIEEFGAMQIVQDAIQNGVEFDYIISIILEQAHKLTGAPEVWIRLLDKHTKKLKTIYAFPGKAESFPDLDITDGKYVNGIDITQPKFWNNISKDSTYPGIFKRGCDITVPILSEHMLIGVLCIWSHRANVFEQEHIIRLQALAYHAGIAIEKAMLLEAISETSLHISRLNEVDFLNFISKVILNLCKTDSSCSVWLYNEHDNSLTHKDISISNDPFVGETVRPIGGISAKAIKEKKPIAIYDIASEKAYRYPKEADRAGYKSVLFIPLLIADRAVGVLNVHTYELYEFSDREVNLLMAFAGYAALAIETYQMIEQLGTQDRAKSELMSVFAHEMRTPLTHIKFFLNRWIKDENLASEYRKQAKMLLHSFERQQELIDKVTTFALMKRQESEKEQILDKQIYSINETIFHAAEKYSLSMNQKNLGLKLSIPEKEVRINADSERIERVLDNLLDNAIKFTPEGGTIFISLYDEPDYARIEIADTGIGISVENQQHIFEDFFSGDSSKSLKGGMGIGLYIVKKLVEMHEGQVNVTSTLSVGSCFTIKLPKGAENVQ